MPPRRARRLSVEALEVSPRRGCRSCRCHEWCRGAREMFGGMAANVVARHEAGLNDNADGDERRHGPPAAHPSNEPRATCRFVWYFDDSDSPTDDRATIVGDVAIAATRVVERRFLVGAGEARNSETAQERASRNSANPARYRHLGARRGARKHASPCRLGCGDTGLVDVEVALANNDRMSGTFLKIDSDQNRTDV